MNHLGDTNKMVETPRTDAALLYSICLDLQDENNALNDRIKRLEEAGDALHEGWLGYGFTKDKHLEAWLKAKESKQ